MKSALTKTRIIVFLLALTCAITITAWFSVNTLQYEFVLSEPKIPVARISQVLYRDLDNDGSSERIEIYNHPRPQDTYYINVNSGGERLINQWYLQDSILIHHLQFLDVTEDQIDELIVWTQGRDSLFLSIIDITDPAKREIFDTFVLHGREHNTQKNWDIGRIHALYSPDKPMSLFFTIFSGRSLKPRGIFEFDLKKHALINEFRFNAALGYSDMFDLNADGKDEILIGTSATSNFPDSVKYSDAFSWFFVFNQQLDLLYSMKKEGTFGGIKFTPGDFKPNPFVYLIATQADRNTEILKLDKYFHIVAEKKLNGYTTDVFKFDEKRRGQVYSKGWQLSKKLTIDTNLVVLDCILIDETKTLSETVDIDNDGKSNFYYLAGNNVYFMNDKMEKIASFEMEDGEKLDRISLKKTPGEQDEIALNTSKYSYLTKLNPSFMHAWLWPLFILQVVLYSSMLYALQLVFIRLRIYFAYFRFSLKESDNAILLINNKGRILTINHKVEQTLMLAKHSETEQDVFSLLQERKEICELIHLALKESRQINETISFSSASSSFIGSITITPLLNISQFGNAYLIEIRDNTEQVLLERQQNWQRNVRRMVHDIKNPLAGVQIKLQTIYLQLMDESPAIADKLQNEIEVANSEIRRIISISKNFSKFTDLAEINLKPVHIENLLSECIDHFKAFVTENLKINLVFMTKYRMAAWDKRQIELLMHILIENAIDALDGKGKITIQVNTLQNLAGMPDQYILIRVEDTGHGITPAQLEKIFEPNYSTKPEGSGMGLLFAKQIVNQHNGKLSVESKTENGTVFEITLPIHSKGRHISNDN